MKQRRPSHEPTNDLHSSTVRTVLATLLASAAAVTFLAGPADAGPCEPEAPDADGRIKFAAVPYVGDDVFNSDGTDQFQGAATGDTDLTQGTWKIRFQNEESK